MKHFFLLLLFAEPAFAQEPPPPVQIEYVEHNSSEEGGIIDFPDVEASFRGGQEAMQRFVFKKLRYPDEAIESNIQGRVYLRFVVTKKGKITDIQVERGAHPLLDQAAIDVVAKMPKWKPAKYKGQKVASRCRMPIIFEIE